MYNLFKIKKEYISKQEALLVLLLEKEIISKERYLKVREKLAKYTNEKIRKYFPSLKNKTGDKDD